MGEVHLALDTIAIAQSAGEIRQAAVAIRW
jgi:hypothetical protein